MSRFPLRAAAPSSPGTPSPLQSVCVRPRSASSRAAATDASGFALACARLQVARTDVLADRETMSDVRLAYITLFGAVHACGALAEFSARTHVGTAFRRSNVPRRRYGTNRRGATRPGCLMRSTHNYFLRGWVGPSFAFARTRRAAPLADLLRAARSPHKHLSPTTLICRDARRPSPAPADCDWPLSPLQGRRVHRPWNGSAQREP